MCNSVQAERESKQCVNGGKFVQTEMIVIKGKKTAESIILQRRHITRL